MPRISRKAGKWTPPTTEYEDRFAHFLDMWGISYKRNHQVYVGFARCRWLDFYIPA